MEMKISIQALYYISTKYNDTNNNTNKMGALKLLFFAEKYHLQQYARMITDDTFFAMKNGPVASGARDVLAFDNMNTDLEYTKKFIKNINSYDYKGIENSNALDMLSETDIEALDFAIENFKHLDNWGLVDETHKYQEWKRYEESFKYNASKRENVYKEDFFTNSGTKDDPFLQIPKEIVALSKEFYLKV